MHNTLVEYKVFLDPNNRFTKEGPPKKRLEKQFEVHDKVFKNISGAMKKVEEDFRKII